MSKTSKLSQLTKWMLFFYLTALTFLSWNPWILPDSKQALGFITWDLIDHATAYGGLSILMMSIFKLKKRMFNITFVVILLSSLLGVFFEYGQYLFTSHRQFSIFDAIANVFGALFGIVIFWLSRFGITFFFNKV